MIPETPTTTTMTATEDVASGLIRFLFTICSGTQHDPQTTPSSREHSKVWEVVAKRQPSSSGITSNHGSMLKQTGRARERLRSTHFGRILRWDVNWVDFFFQLHVALGSSCWRIDWIKLWHYKAAGLDPTVAKNQAVFICSYGCLPFWIQTEMFTKLNGGVLIDTCVLLKWRISNITNQYKQDFPCFWGWSSGIRYQ